MIKALNSNNIIMRKVERFKTATLIKSFNFGNLIFIQPHIFKLVRIIQTLHKTEQT